MIIGGLQKFTLIDFPGKLACTVFTLGCNFACKFCYNSQLVLPEKIKNQPRILEKLFFNFLKERQGLLEGVCVSGGEPTLYQDLPDFLQKIKNLGFLVKLDTNGANPQMLKELIDKKLVDYVALDIKGPKEKYGYIIGVKEKKLKKEIIQKIEECIEILKEEKVDYEFRTTIVPILLKKEDILKIAKWLSPAKRYFLQNFKPERTIDPALSKIKPYSQDYLVSIQKSLIPFFEICQIR